jgi:hypothetical protein
MPDDDLAQRAAIIAHAKAPHDMTKCWGCVVGTEEALRLLEQAEAALTAEQAARARVLLLLGGFLGQIRGHACHQDAEDCHFRFHPDLIQQAEAALAGGEGQGG